MSTQQGTLHPQSQAPRSSYFVETQMHRAQAAHGSQAHRPRQWQALPCHPPQVWFQNARAKFRRNLLRQENTGVDKSADAALQTGTPSGPASELSNASLSPSSTPTTLTDLTSPTLPT
ncbi:hypothetical protein P7K49_001687, partial [Saguinus oedipus]